MYLSEISKLAEEFYEIGDVTASNKEELDELEEEYQLATKSLERYKVMEDITGDHITESLDEMRTKLEEKRRQIKEGTENKNKLEDQIANGLSELKIKLSHDPRLEEKVAIFEMEETDVEQGLAFIRRLIGIEGELELMDVVFERDKIRVKEVNDSEDATNKLEQAVKTIRAFGKSMIGEISPEVMEGMNYVTNSKFGTVWDFLVSKDNITSQEAYDIAQAKTTEDQVWVTDFLNELKKRGITESDSSGKHELTTLGKLMQCYYKYCIYSIPSQ
jgi:chromosome segregation ATPase